MASKTIALQVITVGKIASIAQFHIKKDCLTMKLAFWRADQQYCI